MNYIVFIAGSARYDSERKKCEIFYLISLFGFFKDQIVNTLLTLLAS